MEKTCTRCHQPKPLGEFGIDNRRNSPKAVCRACDSAIHAEIHAKRKGDPEYRQRHRESKRKHYRRKRERGICWLCDSPATVGVYCEVHAINRARTAKIVRASVARICPGCNENVLAWRQKLCLNCSDTKGARFKGYQSRWRFEQRLKTFEKYGGPVCVCCGENNPKFLTIDHINGDGAEHRRQIGKQSLYRWLKRNNYPPGFRVLCFNCNCGREYNGGICPHEEARARSGAAS